MKRKIFVLLSMALVISPLFGQDEEKKLPSVTISGFVNAESFYDIRQTTAGRSGEILLFPKPIVEDANGEDINAVPRWNMVGFMSRFAINASPVEAFGAQVSGKLEFDFLGVSNGVENMLRVRHAFLNMKWTSSELLIGQFWHPMFVTDCFPQVTFWGAGIPVHVLNRSPQIRLTYNLTKEFSILGAIVTQQYHQDIGGADVARNSGLPEIQFQAKYKTDNFVTGFTAGYHWLNPRLVTDSNLVSDEIFGVFNANLFAKVKVGKVTAKLEGIYGQNLSRFVMLGGYAVTAVDPLTDQRTFTATNTGSVWAELIYDTDNLQLGLYTGVTQNMGVDKDIVAGTAKMRGLGSLTGVKDDIGYVGYFVPRIAFKSGKTKLAFEIIGEQVGYGNADSKLQVQDIETVNNMRFLFSATRYF